MSGICDVRSCHMLKGRKRHLEQGQQNQLPWTLHVICFRCMYVQGIIGKSPVPSSQQRETLKANRPGQGFYAATAHSPDSLRPSPTHQMLLSMLLGSDFHSKQNQSLWMGRKAAPRMHVRRAIDESEKLRLALTPGLIPANKLVVNVECWGEGHSLPLRLGSKHPLSHVGCERLLHPLG